jgi:hypothetical protein
MKRILKTVLLAVMALAGCDYVQSTCDCIDPTAINASGEAYTYCLPSDGGVPVLRFDPDKAVAAFEGRYRLFPGVPLDSIRAGAVLTDTQDVCIGGACRPKHLSLSVYFADSAHIRGNYRVRDLDSVSEMHGYLELRKHPEVSCMMP